jgi:branched-chain amino acid transport system substrate-binding protein
MWRKTLLLVLLLALLPACAELAPLIPPAPPSGVQRTDESVYQEAEASYRRQAYRQALAQYGEYLKRYPQGQHATEARLRQAELLGVMGDWQGSLRHYQNLLARQPEPDLAQKARYGIGRAYFKLGQYQQAAQVLDSLTAGDLPRSLWFSTQALLSEIALKQGQVSQAFARLRLAAQDLPAGDQEWFQDLKTRVVEAATRPELEHLANLYPDNPLSAALLLRLAKLAQESGRPEEADKWVSTLKERFPNTPEAAAADRLLTGNKLRVGCLLPLSGQLSNLGFRVQRGMVMAVQGTAVELVFKDTHSEPEGVPALVQDLARERVMAILGPLTSAAAQSAAATAQAAGVPLIALSQKEGLNQIGNLIFQAFLTPRQQVRALVHRALGLGFKRYAVLYPDSNYGRTFQQLFQEELGAQGGELVAQEFYAPGTQDFAPVLTTLAAALPPAATGAAGAEALFVPDDTSQVAAIAAALSGTKLQGIQLLGTNLLHNPTTPEAQLRALEGVLFPNAFFAGDPDPAVQKFLAAYRQRYGEIPDYLSTQGFVVARLLAQLAESRPSLSRTDLPGLLLSLKGVPDLPWFRGFNAEREEDAAIYLLTLKDGSFQQVSGSPSPH